MTIIRGKQATGKQPKIICTGFGNRAVEAGIAMSDNAVEEGYGCGPQGHPSRIMIVTADEEEMQPLCESCVTALEHGETKTADSRSLLTAAANLRLSTEMVLCDVNRVGKQQAGLSIIRANHSRIDPDGQQDHRRLDLSRLALRR